MQISLIVLVDVVATLTERSIANNVYVIDNTQRFARKGDQDTFPTTWVAGVYHADGSQAEEVVLNWVVMSIGALPATLPRDYAYRDPTAERDALFLSTLRNAHTANEAKKIWSERYDAVPMVSPPIFRQSDGRVLMAETPLLDSAGEAVTNQDINAAAYIPIQVNSVRGPAVKNNVIYPALYGSPDLKTGGWYWSASVDTARKGRHLYHMDVVLHRPEEGESGVIIWTPEIYTVTANVDVSSTLEVNGFTGSTSGLPPLPLHIGTAVLTGGMI